MANIIKQEADNFNKAGGVRWIDATDPANQQYMY